MFTASFSALPAVNFATFEAGMSSASPVAGLAGARGTVAHLEGAEAHQGDLVASGQRFGDGFRVASRAVAATARVTPALVAMPSISSLLFINASSKRPGSG